MSFPKSFPQSRSLTAIMLATACLLADRAVSVETAAPAQVTARTLAAAVKTEACPGAEAVRRIHVTTGTNQLAFGLPSGFQVNITSQKITLTRVDGICFLSFRVVTPMLYTTNQPGSDFYRRLATAQYPGANISGEFTARCASFSGPAFDLQWRNSGGTGQITRVAYIPTRAGVVEISLVTLQSKFANDQYFFNTLVASLVNNDTGKLEAPAPPGNS